ncbi:MAG: ADP-heptose:LPS heptosyltransferase, partial [Candidatus Omnitrophota bacterium]
HMACYLDVPVVAIFGPSKPYQYGPWGKGSIYLKGEVPFFNNDLSKDQAGFTDINSVTPEQVLESFSITETGIKIHNG